MKKHNFLDVFIDMLRQKMPEFAPYANQQRTLSKAKERALSKSFESGRMEFVILVQHSTQPKFTVEIAWSDQARFPVVSPRPCMTLPSQEIRYSEYVFRLRCGKAQAECWWKIPDRDDEAAVQRLADEVCRLVFEQADSFISLKGSHGASRRANS